MKKIDIHTDCQMDEETETNMRTEGWTDRQIYEKQSGRLTAKNLDKE